MTMTKQPNETHLAFAKRATDALSMGQINLNEWCEALIGETCYSEENLRRCAVFFKHFLDMTDSYGDSNDLEDLIQAKENLTLERKKLQTVNLQVQEQYRNLARSELLYEQLNDAIREIEPIKVERFEFTKPIEQTALLCVGDQHFDSNFVVNGLYGEVVNKYDRETFYARMWSLLAKMDADKFYYDKLKVVSMGDCIEGLIRMSSLQKLRQPVMHSVIQFAEFMADWLNEASNRLGAPIEFAMVGGNHSVARFLSQKPEFDEENFEYIIQAYIKLRLKDNPNITVEPYNDVYFTTIHGSNMVFAHGDNGTLEKLINYLENLYDVSIDRCYGAHYHSESSKSIGVGNVGSREVIRIPSICGTDTYAKRMLKNNRAGAYFAIFNDDGEVFNKIYYLN